MKKLFKRFTTFIHTLVGGKFEGQPYKNKGILGMTDAELKKDLEEFRFEKNNEKLKEGDVVIINPIHHDKDFIIPLNMKMTVEGFEFPYPDGNGYEYTETVFFDKTASIVYRAHISTYMLQKISSH